MNLASSLNNRIFLLENGTSRNPTGTPRKTPFSQVWENKNKNKKVRKMIPAAETVS